ncbi:glycosyltransferase [Chryseomicrobium palamuruense]
MTGTVVYIGRFNLPDGSASAQRIKVNKKIFEQIGYKVKIISTFEDYNYFDENSLNINNLNPLIERFSAKYIINYIKNIEDLKVIILYNFHSITSLKLLRYARKNDIKVIGDITEWYGLSKSESVAKSFYKLLDTGFRMNYINRKLDGLFVISNHLFDYYMNKTKVLLLPNLVDKEDSKWGLLSENKALQNGIYNFTYVGNPGSSFEKEDLITLVEAFDEINNSEIKLKIIGLEREEYIRIYKRKKGANPSMKNTDFFGKVSHEKALSEIYHSNFFVFIRPNTRANTAGFPTKFMEANYLNTPVITNDIGDISEYINNFTNGYLIYDNNTSTKEELKKIIQMSPQIKCNIHHPFLAEHHTEKINLFLKGL